MNASEAWAALVKEANAKGVRARDCGNGHWRIEGGTFQVNWYPFSKKSSVYVNGMNGRAAFACYKVEDVIRAAIQAPPRQPADNKDRRSKNTIRIKKRLFKRTDRCRWCSCKLAMATATIEHIVPLDLEGAEADYNRDLACKECNQKRGNYHDGPTEKGRK